MMLCSGIGFMGGYGVGEVADELISLTSRRSISGSASLSLADRK